MPQLTKFAVQALDRVVEERFGAFPMHIRQRQKWRGRLVEPHFARQIRKAGDLGGERVGVDGSARSSVLQLGQSRLGPFQVGSKLLLACLLSECCLLLPLTICDRRIQLSNVRLCECKLALEVLHRV